MSASPEARRQSRKGWLVTLAATVLLAGTLPIPDGFWRWVAIASITMAWGIAMMLVDRLSWRQVVLLPLGFADVWLAITVYNALRDPEGGAVFWTALAAIVLLLAGLLYLTFRLWRRRPEPSV